MQVETMKDTLHWTTNFHHELAENLLAGSSRNQDTRAKMLLSYLAEHEQRLAEMVDQYEHSSNKHALDTWCYEYVNRHPIIQDDEPGASFSTLNTHQIMGVLVNHHEQLIDMFQDLATREDIDSARSLAESVRQLEEKEMMRIAQSANRLDDL